MILVEMVRDVLFCRTWAVQCFRLAGRVGFGSVVLSSVSIAGRGNELWKPRTLGNHMRIIATRETLFDFL